VGEVVSKLLVSFSFKKGEWGRGGYTAFDHARMTGIISQYLTVNGAKDNVHAQDIVSALEFG
jgi:hypothetical protein